MKEYITDICELLNIPIPSILYDTSHFTTQTTMAQCELTSNTIYLSKIDTPNPDYLFSIAHELRHLWQYKKTNNFIFLIIKPLTNVHLLKTIIFKLQKLMLMHSLL